MSIQLDFVIALRFIPEFAGRSVCFFYFSMRICFFSRIPESMKPDILEAVLTKLRVEL